MKALFLILSLYAGICQAQILTYKSAIYGMDSMHAPKPIYDTIPVILLVCDTAKLFSPMRTFIFEANSDTGYEQPREYEIRNTGPCFWILGYEVMMNWHQDMGYIQWNDGGGYTGKPLIHVEYLDSNKKRLNLLVWDVREVSK